MKNVAIIYHYFASYRIPILRKLMTSEHVKYFLYSGISSEIEIKKIDPNFSRIPITKSGLRWFFLKNKWLLNKRFLWQTGLLTMILNTSYDSYIFLGSPYHLSTWVAAIIVRVKNKKVYFWMHGVYKEKLSFVDYIKLFVFYKIANGYFLYGNRSASILRRYKIRSSKNIHIVYNSLDYYKCLKMRKDITKDDIFSFRKIMFNDENIPIVCFIGRLNRTKKIDWLLSAQIDLSRKYNKSFFNAIIIGDGAEKANLEVLARDGNMLNHVYFTGSLYKEREISKILMHSDVCINPGEIGLTCIHSMSYGTPVISHNNLNKQMPEVEAVDCGLTGDLYDYEDYDSFLAVIEKWFKTYPIKDTDIIKKCQFTVDSYYNPNYQQML